jgi:hypothetical protein
MYVKVTHGDAMGGDFLLPVTGPIHSGSIAISFDPNAQDHDVGGELAKELGRQMLYGDGAAVQSMPLNRIHVLEIDQHRTQYEANKNLLAVRYVWWDEPMDGLHAVVTTRNIFIVGDDGKTIDRVR